MIPGILSTLPIEAQQQILDELAVSLRPIPAPRAGNVLGAIVRLLPYQKNWTVESLKKGVADAGVGASAKEIYNALGYLTRHGHIQRVGYGRYNVAGVENSTTEFKKIIDADRNLT